jgi:hypothetical protein
VRISTLLAPPHFSLRFKAALMFRGDGDGRKSWETGGCLHAHSSESQSPRRQEGRAGRREIGSAAGETPFGGLPANRSARSHPRTERRVHLLSTGSTGANASRCVHSERHTFNINAVGVRSAIARRWDAWLESRSWCLAAGVDPDQEDHCGDLHDGDHRHVCSVTSATVLTSVADLRTAVEGRTDRSDSQKMPEDRDACRPSYPFDSGWRCLELLVRGRREIRWKRRFPV